MMHWLLMLSVSLVCCRAFPLPTRYPFHVVDEVDEEQDEGPLSLSWGDEIQGIKRELNTLSTAVLNTGLETKLPLTSIEGSGNSKEFKDIESKSNELILVHPEIGADVVHFSHGNSTKGHTPDTNGNTNVNSPNYGANSKAIATASGDPPNPTLTSNAYEEDSDFNSNTKTSRFVLTTSEFPVESLYSTNMVYIAHSSTDLTSSPSLSNVPWTPDASMKDVLLGVCVTVVGVFTLCVLVTFTSCCCRKRKAGEGEESEDSETTEKGQVRNNRKKDPLKKAPSSSGLDSPTEGSTSLSKQLDIRKSCPNFQDVDSNSLSVKDRIKAFEFYQNEQEIKLRDGSKPKRKKPTSKAFDEFESQGIIIGFGGNQRRRTSTEGSGPDASEELKDYHQLPPIPTQHLHPHQQQDRFGIQQLPEEIKGPSEEFEAVPRNTDILKSFRRAPPPKNRTRARRSGRRRPHGPNDGVSVIAEDQEDEEKEFESSLHMQPSTPQSNARTTIRVIERLSKDITDSPLNRSFLDSPQSLRSSLRSQPDNTFSHYSDFDVKSRKDNELTVDLIKELDAVSANRSRSFSEGLSNTNNANNQHKQSSTKSSLYSPKPQSLDPFQYSLNPANVTLSSLRRDLPKGKKIDLSHNGHSNGHPASENWSPQPQRPVSVGGVPMRRWASDHNPSLPRDVRDVPRSPLLDVPTWATQDTANKDASESDTNGRKYRYEDSEQPRIYPKSEKLLRKAIASIPGNFTPPPNLLYRPYYHTSNNVTTEPQVSNGHRQYQRTRSESWAGNTPNSMIVHFNIDTEPTNV